MKVEIGKTYRTRGGYPARVLMVDFKGPQPVVAAVLYPNGNETLNYYDADGTFDDGGPYHLDLVEVKPEYTRYVNIYQLYENEQTYSISETREAANAKADRTRKRLACIPITFHEGDGLEEETK